jgi:hypothetical protein
MVSPGYMIKSDGVNRMRRQERIAHWQGIVEKQAESGLSGIAFCREHNISLQRFYHWRRRLKNEESHGDSTTGFFELVPCSAQPRSGIRVRIGDELSIEVDRDFDPFTLRAVIEAVGAIKPCSR